MLSDRTDRDSNVSPVVVTSASRAGPRTDSPVPTFCTSTLSVYSHETFQFRGVLEVHTRTMVRYWADRCADVPHPCTYNSHDYSSVRAGRPEGGRSVHLWTRVADLSVQVLGPQTAVHAQTP